ncbi:MAG: hypothetical protein ACO3P0_11745, partial [Quisquiliibacterium sp.]
FAAGFLAVAIRDLLELINQVGNPWLRGTAAHGTRAIHRRMHPDGEPLVPYANEFGAKKTPGISARRFLR